MMKEDTSIDELRRLMVTTGLSHSDAATATGLAAEYAQRAYMNGYGRGCNVGAYIDELRKEEGSSVTINCDNPEFCGCAVKIAVQSDWTRWGNWEYGGDTILECLEKAVAAKKMLTGREDDK
jgi:hypothetical protein